MSRLPRAAPPWPLARGAKVAAPSADHDAADRHSAARTRKPRSGVCLEARLELARMALDVNVVAEARSLQLNRPPQNAADNEEQSLGCGSGKRSGRRLRMNARCKQRFIRVDVAQARQHPLVQKPSLDRAAPTAEGVLKLPGCNFQGVRAEGAKNSLRLARRAATEHSEPPWIAEAQLFAVFAEADPHVRMWQDRRMASRDNKLPRHAESHHKVPCLATVRGQADSQGLALAPHRPDPPSFQEVPEGVGLAADHERVQDFDRPNPTSGNAAFKPAADCFNFWKLGHDNSGRVSLEQRTGHQLFNKALTRDAG